MNYLVTKSHKKCFGLMTILLTFAIYSTVEAANIQSESYAWSESVGWIKFDTGAGDITVSDSTITGHAYNDNIGWITLEGVSNDGEGNLSGYAWSESVGYIDFSDVKISNNQFQGYAYNDNIGFISLNCSNTDTCGDVGYKVSTTWAPKVEEIRQTSSRRSGGTSISGRIKNLERMGKVERANELRDEFNVTPTTKPSVNTPNNTSLSQLIETLISLSVIPEDKVEQARKTLESIPESNSTQFNRDLELKSEGEDVRKLQQHLINAGYSIPDGPTNFFGSQTQSALIQFQIDNNISPAIGYFGPITREFIK